MIDRVDDETLLDRFRQLAPGGGLQAGAAGARAGGSVPRRRGRGQRRGPGPEVGIFQVIEEFTALKARDQASDPKLQGPAGTEASAPGERCSRPSTSSARSSPRKIRRPGRRASRWPRLWPTLTKPLDRGRTELEKASRRLIEATVQAMHSAFDAVYAQNSWIKRRLLKSYRRTGQRDRP